MLFEFTPRDIVDEKDVPQCKYDFCGRQTG